MRAGPGRTISDPVTDNFNRASLGADWTVHLGNVATVTSTHWGASASSGVFISSWTATSITGDQVVEATIATGWDSRLLAQPFVRRRSSDSARYGFGYDDDPTFVATPIWYIKYDGVATELTRLLSEVTGPAAPVAGDRLRLEARGTNPVLLKGYHNGILRCSASDATADRVTTGPPGLVARPHSGVTLTYPLPVFNDFAAGTLL